MLSKDFQDLPKLIKCKNKDENDILQHADFIREDAL